VASVRELRGCHTQGRTVDETRRRIRKAMELFVDDARSASGTVEEHLSKGIRHLLNLK
jgi:predicted RNase H-like HicB family nuclease